MSLWNMRSIIFIKELIKLIIFIFLSLHLSIANGKDYINYVELRTPINLELRKDLLELQQRDQKVRSDKPIDMILMSKIDRENTIFVKDIIKAFGWPTSDLVGKEGMRALFLIIQHAVHDLEFQKQGLLEFKSLLKTDSSFMSKIVYLSDRIAMQENRAQKYGTQGNCVAGKFIVYTLENNELVDQYRTEAGLMPIGEYITIVEKNSCKNH